MQSTFGHPVLRSQAQARLAFHNTALYTTSFPQLWRHDPDSTSRWGHAGRRVQSRLLATADASAETEDVMASVYEFDHEEEVLLVRPPCCKLKSVTNNSLLDVCLTLGSFVAFRENTACQGRSQCSVTKAPTRLYLCRSENLGRSDAQWLQHLLPCRNISHLQVKDYPGLLRVVAWVLNGLELIVKRAK